MILRSLTKHVKDQNWFAVWIDFVIVVIGVFIGIQVANWNEERAPAIRDEILLERLMVDFVRIAEWGKGRMPRHRGTADDTRRLIEVIRSDAEPTLDEDTRALLAASVEVYAGSEASPTYEELVATGTLSRVRNVNLRNALNRYSRQREADMVLLTQQLQIRDSGPMEEAVQFRVSSQSYDDTLIAESFDWALLKSTEPYLQKVLRNQLLRNRWQTEELNSALEIIALIEAEL